MAKANTEALARAMMAEGYAPQAPQYVKRSEYLAKALEQMAKSGGQNIQSGGELAAKLLAVAMTEGKDRKNQAFYIAAPDAMIGASVKGYEPVQVSQGNTLLNAPGGGAYTAPTMGVDGGFGYTQTPEGFNVTGQRPQSYVETETSRHNQVGESQGWRGLDIGQQNADTGAYSAQTGRMAYEARKAAGGFGTPGVGGVLGANIDPNEWEIIPGAGAAVNAPRR